MYRILLLVSAFITPFISIGQTNIDSLLIEWNNETRSDSLRLSSLSAVIEYCMHNNVDSALYYLDLHHAFALEAEDTYWEAYAVRLKGRGDNKKGDINAALEKYYQSLSISETNQDTFGMGRSYNHIAGALVHKGDYFGSIKMFSKALDLARLSGDSVEQAFILNNLGYTSMLQGSDVEATHYLEESLIFSEAIGEERGYGLALQNLATVYMKVGIFDKAEAYYHKARKYIVMGQDKINEAKLLGEMGVLKLEMDQLDSAMLYVNQSLAIAENINFLEGIALGKGFLGMVYMKKGQFAISLQHCLEAKKVAEQIGLTYEIQRVSFTMYKSYKGLGAMEKALEMLEFHGQITDSLYKEQNRLEMMRTAFEYKYKKKAVEDSIQYINQVELEQLKISKQQAQLDSEKKERYVLYMGIFALVLVVSMLLYAKRRSDRDGMLISNQHQELKERTREIRRINVELESQNQAIISFNESLEEQVENRTEALGNSLKQLQQYQWQLSHKIRAPLTTLMGLINLVQRGNLNSEHNEKIFEMLSKNSEDLNQLLKEMREILDQ